MTQRRLQTETDNVSSGGHLVGFDYNDNGWLW